MAQLNLVKALNLALSESLRDDDGVVLLGQDIGLDGGVFRVTEGLMNEYGENRVMDTPLAESGIAGSCVGMALYGLKPVYVSPGSVVSTMKSIIGSPAGLSPLRVVILISASPASSAAVCFGASAASWSTPQNHHSSVCNPALKLHMRGASILP